MFEEKNILIADNDIKTVECAAAVLKIRGYEIFFADNSVKTEILLKKNIYGLLLININLTPVNGFEICRKIRGLNNRIPVIFLTDEGRDIKKITEYYSVGGQDYIVKPFIPEELAARVECQLKVRDYNERLCAAI